MPRGLTLDSPWHEFLTEINDRLTAPVQLVCIEGFVVTQIFGFSRATADLDQILTTPRELSEELEQLAGNGSPLHRKYGSTLIM